MTKELALKACKDGAIAAAIAGVLTLAFFVFATTTNAEGDLALWNDPLIIVDIVIVFACAFGISRRSRAAAITMTVYWVFAKTYTYLETGVPSGLIISLVFLYFFGKAIQGSFVYHRLMKEEDPDYRAAPRWYYFVGIPVLGIAFLLFVMGLLSMTDYAPSTEVVNGSEVSVEDRDALIKSGVLYNDENIELFYSYGIFSVLEGGNVLTDRAVVTYYVDENDKFTIYEYEFNQIESIQLYSQGDLFSDSIYKINSFGEDNWFTVELSAEAEGDVRFIDELRKKVEAVKSEDEAM